MDAPANSIVETIGFANPPVVKVDVALAATVVICTAVAAPPPHIIPKAQLNKVELSDGITETVIIVPAIPAAGVAIESRTLSNHGT